MQDQIMEPITAGPLVAKTFNAHPAERMGMLTFKVRDKDQGVNQASVLQQEVQVQGAVITILPEVQVQGAQIIRRGIPVIVPLLLRIRM